MKVQRDQAIAATTSSVLDAIFEIDYGVNVFKLDKSESSVFYKTTTSELMLLPYPTWNEDLTTAAGEAAQVSGFFNMAYFQKVSGKELWQQAGVEWLPSDLVKQPDVLRFYTIVQVEDPTSLLNKVVSINVERTERPKRTIKMSCKITAFGKDATAGTF